MTHIPSEVRKMKRSSGDANKAVDAAQFVEAILFLSDAPRLLQTVKSLLVIVLLSAQIGQLLKERAESVTHDHTKQ